MASKLTPKQFNIYPATNRIKAEVMLENVALDNFADSTIVRNALYLVRHADVSCRLNGEASIALRNLSGYQFAKLVIGMANNSVMGSDVCAYIYNFLGMNEAPDPVQPAPVVTKRNLSFQEASDLLAENPERTDIQGLFTYLGTVHTIKRCERISYGWDFLFDTWNVQYEDTPEVVDWLWQEATNASASEPLPVVTDATVTPYPTGSVVMITGVQHEVQPDGVFKQLPPVAPQPVSRVQWYTSANLRSENTAYLGYMARYNARQSAPMPRSAFSRGSQVVRQANMAKGGKKAFIPPKRNKHRRKPTKSGNQRLLGGEVLRPNFNQSYVRIAS